MSREREKERLYPVVSGRHSLSILSNKKIPIGRKALFFFYFLISHRAPPGLILTLGTGCLTETWSR